MRRLALAVLAACTPPDDDGPVDDTEPVDSDPPAATTACPRLRDTLRDCWGVSGVELGRREAPWLPVHVEQHLTPADLDGDGLPDLVATEFLGPVRLWRNLGGFTFEDATDAWGLDVQGAWGADAADLDRDGDLDLIVTAPDLPGTARAWIDGREPKARLVVLENAGGAFVDRTRAWGFDPVACAGRCVFVGAAFQDLNGDGILDVVPVNHVSDAQPIAAFVSDGPGRWVRDDARLAPVRGELYAAVFAHLDGDDRVDFLPVVNQNTGELSWPRVLLGTHDGFEEVATGSAWFGEGAEVSAFTAASVADVDHDGDADVALADYRKVVVLRGHGDGTFEDELLADGRPSQAVAWFDHDGDGWDDLWVFLGVNEREPVPFGTHRLWRNAGGVLEEVDPPFTEGEPAGVVGVAVSDLDRDGRPDLVLGGAGARPRLLRNGFRGRWLAVALDATASAPGGFGARVTVEVDGRVASATMGADGSPGSSSEAVLWFGLGEAEAAERVTVRWPSGREDTWTDVPRGLRVLREGP